MKLAKKLIFVNIAFFISTAFSGCWNYREIDKLGIVAGVAVDSGTNARYKITVELAEISEGKEAKPESKVVSMEGNTMFDAVRRIISISGKRLYWSHAKVIIINKDLAKKSLIKIIDWYNRDSETRADVDILISGEATAGEIFRGREITDVIRSYELHEMLLDEASLSEAPKEEVWKFINDLQGKGIDPVVPVVRLKNADNKLAPEISGTAVFKDDKLIGFMDKEDTKDMLFIKNLVKKGVLVQPESGPEGPSPVSLEIFKNTTELVPNCKGKNIHMNINVKTNVAIDEIEGSKDFIENKGLIKLTKDAEKTMENRLKSTIENVQSEYAADIFGFGSEIYQNYPDLWNKVEKDWNEIFKDLKVSINVDIHIRNSAMTSKTIQSGE